MGEIPNPDRDKNNTVGGEPVGEKQDPSDKKVQIVPVEQLIPEIKPPQTDLVKGVDYRSHKFDDMFIDQFFEYVFQKYTDSPKVWPIFREKFKDQIVVDLGANNHSLGYFLSAILGAKGYVGVEKFHSQRLKESLDGENVASINRRCKKFDMFSGFNPSKLKAGGKEVPEPSKDLIPASVVEDDMLSFLRRLPDNSVSIFTFGITYEIISPSYAEAVSKEIDRVLSKNGMYIKDSSSIPSGGLKRFSEGLTNKDTGYLLAFLKQEGFFVKK